MIPSLAPTALPLDISVRSAERHAILGAKTAAEFCAAIEQYAESLAREAGLSLAPRASLRDAADEEAFLDGERFRLRIGSRLARTRLHADRTRALDRVSFEILEALYANRLALLAAANPAEVPTPSGKPNGNAGGHATFVVSQTEYARHYLLELGVGTGRLTYAPDVTDIDVHLDQLHDAALGWSVECHPSQVEPLGDALQSMRETQGIPLPPPQLRQGPVSPDAYRLRINDISLPLRSVADDIRAALGESDSFALVAGLRQSIERDVARCAHLFVSGGVADLLLSSMRRSAAPLVDCARQRFSSAVIARTMRGLLEEELPIWDMRGVLEAMLTAGGRSGVSDRGQIVFLPHTGGMLLSDDPPHDAPLRASEFVEIVRAQQSRAIRMQIAPGFGVIPVYVGDQAFEDAIVRSARSGKTDDAVNERTLVQRLADTVLVGGEYNELPAIIAVSSPARRALHELVRIELPHLRAVNWFELPAESDVTITGRIEAC